MPTLLAGRSLTWSARLRIDALPFVVVILLSLLFAMTFWAAFAPRPFPDVASPTVQGGL